MVAGYPDAETRYRKPVDNPNQDNRCITTLHQLNKNYDKTVNGELIDEPILDRVVLSLARQTSNPHEVLPAQITRYAIRLQYFDKKNERDAEQQCSRKLKGEQDV